MKSLPASPLRGWTGGGPVRSGVAPESAVKALSMLKAEYSAALPSRFRRTRTGLGGLGDAHMLSSGQFYSVREYARDMERNDALFKQLVERAIDMRIGGGPVPRPNTGDKNLDGRLMSKWARWAGNPFLCDAAKRRAFPELVRAWEQRQVVDGDIFAVPDDATGSIQSIEGDHVDSPMQMGGNVFHGVRLSETLAPVEYQFVEEREQSRFAHNVYYSAAKYHSRPAFDENGDPVVLHIYEPMRMTQTRGITAFHAVFDYLGMVEDVNFATLVKQQMASMVMGYLESDIDQQIGSRSTVSGDDGIDQTLQEMQPGILIRGRPGTRLTAFTPNIPGHDFQEHIKFLARVLGGALHLPLEIVLMDYSQGNFSSQRMAIDQARQAVLFRRESLARLTLQHIWNWKARGWLAEEGLDATEHPELLDHKWQWGGFPYHDKRADAEADKVRVDNLQVSPRDLAQENGFEWSEIVAETIEDRAAMIEAAQKEATRLSTPDAPVTWEQVLGIAPPAGVTQSQAKADPAQLDAQKDMAESAAKAKGPEVTRAEVTEIVRAAMTELVAALRPVAAPVAAAPSIQFTGDAKVIMPESSAVTLNASLEERPINLRMEAGAIQNATTFAPVNNIQQTIEAKAGAVTVESKVAVDARVTMPARAPRVAEVVHADGTRSVITEN